jgi:hypothetical protein
LLGKNVSHERFKKVTKYLSIHLQHKLEDMLQMDHTLLSDEKKKEFIDTTLVFNNKNAKYYTVVVGVVVVGVVVVVVIGTVVEDDDGDDDAIALAVLNVLEAIDADWANISIYSYFASHRETARLTYQ